MSSPSGETAVVPHQASSDFYEAPTHFATLMELVHLIAAYQADPKDLVAMRSVNKKWRRTLPCSELPFPYLTRIEDANEYQVSQCWRSAAGS